MSRMNDNQLSVVHDPGEEVIRSVIDGVYRYGVEVIGGREPKRLAVLSKSSEGEVLGGGVGHELLGVFYITHLWVTREYRNQGIGGRLLAAMEEEAERFGCAEIRLDTLNARALPFYSRYGYEAYASLPEYVPGFERVFLRKPRQATNGSVV